MDWVSVVYLGTAGTVLGSFYNVVGLRVPEGIPFTGKERSRCPSCGHTLSAIELVPVLSWVFQRGRCRHCQGWISLKYPLVELSTGLLFVLSFIVFGWSLELIVALLFVSMLTIITVSDLATMLIPDKILIAFGVPVLFLRLFVAPLDPWWLAIVGAMTGFGILLLLAIASKGGMGGGDIKLYFVIGLVLGPAATVLSLFLAAFVGLIFGLPARLSGKSKRGTPIPFGPFIALGAVIAYFYGTELINWYTSFLL
ncbi:prepilin peptidase [Salisediminibacterium beveridgei]|nr:A24 family peptidase [Salisediminibacterium beveridgei]